MELLKLRRFFCGSVYFQLVFFPSRSPYLFILKLCLVIICLSAIETFICHRELNRVYFLRFCIKHNTRFSYYRIELKVALSLKNATKSILEKQLQKHHNDLPLLFAKYTRWQFLFWNKTSDITTISSLHVERTISVYRKLQKKTKLYLLRRLYTIKTFPGSKFTVGSATSMSRTMYTVQLTLILEFAAMGLFYGKCRARSTFAFVQSDLAQHPPLIFNSFSAKEISSNNGVRRGSVGWSV